MHIPADVTGCTPATTPHSLSSTTAAHLSAGGTFICNTCHASTAPLVVNAIATNNSECSACHPAGGDHLAQHNTTTPASCQGSGCHMAETNLVPIHLAIGCQGCHASPTHSWSPRSPPANKNCSACHPARMSRCTPRPSGDLPGLRLPRTGHQPRPDPHRDRLRRLPQLDRPARDSGDHGRQHRVRRLPSRPARAAAARHHRSGRPARARAATHRPPTSSRSTPRSAAPAATRCDRPARDSRDPAGNTACAACHPARTATPPCTTQRVPAGCQGSGCHNQTNLIPIHTAIGCAGCHESTDPNVVGAIASGQQGLLGMPPGWRQPRCSP